MKGLLLSLRVPVRLLLNFATESGKGPKESTQAFVVFVCIAAFLVLFAGLMSGLTLGLLSLTNVELEVLRRSGTPKEQLYAHRIQPVLKSPHWLLATLVLCNAAATEALPIFLDRLADPITAVLISITVVLIFGEIIPQAVCSRYGLAVGAYSAWFVQVLMGLTAVIAWPISKILDAVLGTEEHAMFRRAQLKALMDIHGLEEGLGGNLSTDEISVIRGALDLSNKNALMCMTPLDKVFMLPTNATLGEDTLMAILDSGHSRIPVHKPGQRTEIVGQIIVKELILIDKAAHTCVSDIKMRSLPFLRCDTTLYDMLRLFEAGRCHMAVLHSVPARQQRQDPSKSVIHRTQMADMMQIRVDSGVLVTPAGDSVNGDHEYGQDPFDDSEDEPDGEEPEVLGIITIEDVIEELLQQEIIDETDQFVDNNRSQRVNAQFLMRNLPKHLRTLVLAHQTRVGHLAALSKDKNLLPTRSRRSHMPVLTPQEWRDLPPEERWDTRGGRAAYLQARGGDAPQVIQVPRRTSAAGDNPPLRRPLLDSSDDEDSSFKPRISGASV